LRHSRSNKTGHAIASDRQARLRGTPADHAGLGSSREGSGRAESRPRSCAAEHPTLPRRAWPILPMRANRWWIPATPRRGRPTTTPLRQNQSQTAIVKLPQDPDTARVKLAIPRQRSALRAPGAPSGTRPDGCCDSRPVAGGQSAGRPVSDSPIGGARCSRRAVMQFAGRGGWAGLAWGLRYPAAR
jgi:hypothetical protein